MSLLRENGVKAILFMPDRRFIAVPDVPSQKK